MSLLLANSHNTVSQLLYVGVEILNHCIKPPKTGRDTVRDTVVKYLDSNTLLMKSTQSRVVVEDSDFQPH